MAQIPFTLRELRRAWVSLHAASKQLPRGNAHRLLLLYAIECGLKAVWIKRESRTLYDGKDASGNSIGGPSGHDLSEVIKQLRLGVVLPLSFDLNEAKDERKNPVARRPQRIDALHQAWRYGGELVSPPVDDAAMEQKLEAVQRLIEKEFLS